MDTRRGYRLAFLALIVSALLAAFPAAASAERTLGVSQGVFDISLPPGGTYTGRFLAQNAGTEDLAKVYVYTADIRFDEKGNANYVPVTKEIASTPGKLLTSAASWTRLDLPDNTRTDYNAAWVNLAEGEKMPVDFTVTIPANAAPGDYGAAIFLEMGSEDTSISAGSASVVAGRIGSRLHIRVAGTVKEDFRYDFRDVPKLVFGQSIPVDFRFDNKGNIDVKAEATLALQQGSDRIQDFGMGNFKSFYLPAQTGMSDKRTLFLEGWNLGYRDLVYRVSYRDEGMGRQVDDQRTARVFFLPWPLIAIVAILLTSFLGYMLSRRRSRRPAPAAAEPAGPAEDALEAEAREAAEAAAAAAYRSVIESRKGTEG